MEIKSGKADRSVRDPKIICPTIFHTDFICILVKILPNPHSVEWVELCTRPH